MDVKQSLEENSLTAVYPSVPNEVPCIKTETSINIPMIAPGSVMAKTPTL
jgi:hypothetical protein